MAISIDTVYQRVLALANKEQRGYITPQEFNLFANQAQMDIFEQYFYDINQFGRASGNETEYSDPLTMLNEKISIFKFQKKLVYNKPVFEKIPLLYRLGVIFYKGTEVQQVNYSELLNMNKSLLSKPSEILPVFFERQDGYIIKPESIIEKVKAGEANVVCTYVKKPATVNWGYNVVGEHALYDNTISVDFELHPSDETNLVVKILALAGITLKDPGVYQIASSEDNKNTQQEKQ